MAEASLCIRYSLVQHDDLGTRVVQAWRTSGWPVGLYSIARFELGAAGGGTKLTFDHAGFPKGDGAHLANGWYLNYWTPMEKHFAAR